MAELDTPSGAIPYRGLHPQEEGRRKPRSGSHRRSVSAQKRDGDSPAGGMPTVAASVPLCNFALAIVALALTITIIIALALAVVPRVTTACSFSFIIHRLPSHYLEVLLSAMGLRSLVTLALPSVSSATLLYVSSYSGTLTTLKLTTSGPGNGGGLQSSLEQVAVSNDCAPNPAWLTLDSANGILYCLDEGLSTPNGTLVSFETSEGGVLTQLSKAPTIQGPVSAVVYGNNGTGLAVAEYSGSGLQSYLIADPSKLEELQKAVFKLEQPGPNPERQEAPHPHHASLDPTGSFIIVPDLGADLLRVFAVDNNTLEWTESTPLATPGGSGPRHVAWLAAKSKTFLFLISELANTITSYEVTYGNDNLSFKQVYTSSTHGPNATVPAGTSAAEVVVSPDHKFLLLSSRNESSITIPNFDTSNSTDIVSDPIITYSIDQETGQLQWLQNFPAGGLIPRQFSLNKDGTLVGVGLQGDGRAVVINRDPTTGLLRDFAASIPVAGQVTAVVFDE